MPKYTENTGDFESEQWTGSNQTDITALIAKYRGPDWEWTVDREGALRGVQRDMDRLLIPLDHWFVAGPMWGDEDPNDVPFKVMSGGKASKRFQRKPGSTK